MFFNKIKQVVNSTSDKKDFADLAVKYNTLLIGPHHKRTYRLDSSVDREKLEIALEERQLRGVPYFKEADGIKADVLLAIGEVGVRKENDILKISAPNERGLLVFLTIEKASRQLRSSVDKARYLTGSVSRMLTADNEVIEVEDVRYGPLFANALMTLDRNEWQPLPVTDYCQGTLEKQEFRGKELTVTRKLRRLWDKLKTFFKGAKDNFRLQPQYSRKDQPALLLPRDNTVGENLGVGHVDYLGYHAEPYKKFIKEFFWSVYNTASSEEQRKVAKLLLLDYSSKPPCANPIAFEGTKTLNECWPQDFVDKYSSALAEVFKKSFEKSARLMRTDEDEFQRRAAKLNGSKGTGPCGFFPDGTPFSPKKYVYTVLPNGLSVDTLSDEDRLAFLSACNVRKDNSPLKLAWAPFLAERILPFFKYAKKLWDERDNADYSDELLNEMVGLICDQNFPEHDEAYRFNNGDPAINDPDPEDKDLSNYQPFSKDRDVRMETSECTFEGGLLDNKKLNDAFREHTQMAPFQYVAKVRPMFPGNSPCFYATYVQLAKLLVFEIEHGAAGFPSNRALVMQRYQKFLTKHPEGVKFLAFDRRTSEQWITDNWRSVIQLFKGWPQLQILINALCHCVCKSNLGIRFMDGGLLSGTPLTTLINVVVGGAETCFLISRVLGVDPQDVVSHYFAQLEGKEEFWLIGEHEFCFNLGTDDQVIAYSGPTIEIDQEFAEARSLALDSVVDDSGLLTVFGLDFQSHSIEVSSFLAIYKLFLFEKSRFGDEIAHKYAKRLEALNKWVPILEPLFQNNNFGSITDYAEGSKNFQQYIDKFGFDQPFDEESFSDSIILSGEYITAGYDPIKDSRKYPHSVVFDIIKQFESVLLTDYELVF